MKFKLTLLAVCAAAFFHPDPTFAQSWVQTSAPHLAWSSVASSADGTRLAAAIDEGLIYVSTNSGADWNATSAPNESWNSIASSADGTTLVAVGSAYVIMGDTGSITFGLIYTSTNSGASWIKASGVPTNVDWTTVSCSADGTKQVAAGVFTSIYTSTNSGISWEPTGTPSGQWGPVISSADGNKLVGALAGGPIYTSTNAGGDWTKTSAPTNFWRGLASSSDGTKLIATTWGTTNLGSIYASRDSGATWTLTGAPSERWTSVTSSADGTKLAAVAAAIPNGPLYVSTDPGATWTTAGAPNEDWTSIASSADGNKLVAVISDGYGIYTYHAPVPLLNLTISAGEAILSWDQMGTNLVLQQNSDLGTTNWTPVTGISTLTNSQNQIMLPRAAGSMFYRFLAQESTVPAGMALIPAGSFLMGNFIVSNFYNTATSDLETDATPATITVSGFYMDVNLVSLGQWTNVFGYARNHGYSFANLGSGKGTNYPVETVQWFVCVAWCNARSAQAGLTPVYYSDAGFTQVYTNSGVSSVYANMTNSGYRLPTEAEWEKAARGGLVGNRFPWGNFITESQANYYGDTNDFGYDLGPNGDNAIGSIGGADPATSPVGSFAPNGYGLYDMAGNVFEWCWDWYGTPYGQPTTTNPTGPASGSYRVIRGGYWGGHIYSAYTARCAFRDESLPTEADNGLGFRCVKGL